MGAASELDHTRKADGWSFGSVAYCSFSLLESSDYILKFANYSCKCAFTPGSGSYQASMSLQSKYTK